MEDVSLNDEIFDMIIVGGGPAGFTTALYACRARLKVLMLEKYVFGGQVTNTYEIKNYPGFEEITGPELVQKMHDQVVKCGLKTLNDTAIDYDFKDDIKLVKTEYNGTLNARTIVLCMGADARKLGAKNEEKLKGRGVCYCAICDGPLYKDRVVAVIGGGDSAMEDATYLTSVAKKVYLIHRRDEFRAQQILQDRVFDLSKQGKIELILSSGVEEIMGDNFVTGIKVKNYKTEEIKEIAVDGVFVTVGREPDTVSIDAIEKDEKGYIIVNNSMETNIKGVYAAGDCTQKELRQIITACSDGAIAATKANIFIKSQKRQQKNN